MGKKIFLGDAESILSDVKPEQCFWVHNGPIVRNLHELEKALEHMNEETFGYHVYNSRNDFANWVKDIIKDDELADILQKAESKDKTLKEIRDRIKFIEETIDKERLKSSNLESANLIKNINLKDKFSKDTGVFILGIVIGIAIGIVIAIKFNIS
jgi:hypothetical protein